MLDNYARRNPKFSDSREEQPQFTMLLGLGLLYEWERQAVVLIREDLVAEFCRPLGRDILPSEPGSVKRFVIGFNEAS